MKNILIIIPSLERWWGAETVASTVWNSLSLKWYKIHYFTFYNATNSLNIKWNLYSLEEKKTNNLFSNFFKLFIRSYKISQYTKSHDIETSISHLDEANFSTLLSKVIFSNKSKIIIEIHNSLEKSFSCTYLLLYKIFLRFADKVVSLTREDLWAYKMNFFLNSKQIVNIYNPVNTNFINILQQKIIDEYGIDNNDFILVNIWRLSLQKNQQLLIKAFIKFHSQVPCSKLFIIGEWTLRSKLELQASHLLNKNIFILGRVDNPYKYLNTAQYLVMSSNYEGLPVSQIESLACHTPIISTDCKTGPKEIIHLHNENFDRSQEIVIWDCWILYPLGSEEALVKALMIAYKNENNIYHVFKKNTQIKIKSFELEKIIPLREDIILET